jgi:hypothetical protein
MTTKKLKAYAVPCDPKFKSPVTTKKKAIKVTVSKKALAPVIKKITEELKGKLASKPATILYKKLPDDMILITGFENFLTPNQLIEKYGSTVGGMYCGYPNHVYLIHSDIPKQGDYLNLKSVVNWEEKSQRIQVNSLWSKKGFSTIIAHVKKCGGLLHEIIAAVNGGEVKRITI